MASPQDWHILGAGSIGCLWASKLLKKRQQPIIIVRPPKDQSSAELKLVDLDGAVHCWPVGTVTAQTLNQPIERLLLCTKAQDAFGAIHSIANKLADNCQIVLMQNGMGSQQQIAQAFDQHTVYAASTTEGAWLKAPFYVCHAGTGSTWIGPITNKAKQQDSNFPCLSDTVFHVKNIEGKLWDKLAINCAINGLTALYDCRNGELLTSEKYRKQLYRLIEEIIAVRKALAIPAPDNLQQIIENVCKSTGANHSSTCMDARQNRKTELAFINGYLIRQAQQSGIQTPVNNALMNDLSEAGILF